LSGPTWDAYRAAYIARYGVAPVRNATVNAQLANLVKRLGAEEAPLVATFYLGSQNAWFVKQGHSVGALLNKCEMVRTEWATGRETFDSLAALADRAAGTGQVFKELIQEIKDDPANWPAKD